jgi:hypothetical protein
MSGRKSAWVRKCPDVWSACAAALVWVLAGQAQAEEKIWQGGSASWNTAENWSPSGVPGSGDVAIFTNTVTANCVIDAAVDVQALRIAAGYTGQVSQGANPMTIGSGGFTIASGTFQGGTGAISIGGNRFIGTGGLHILGGSFTSTTNTLTTVGPFHYVQGTFNHNSGTIVVKARDYNTYSNVPFWNFVFDDGDEGNPSGVNGDTLDVNGDLTVVSGYFGMSAAHLCLAGNLAQPASGVNALRNYTSWHLVFDGTNAQTWDPGTTHGYSYLTISNQSPSGVQLVNRGPASLYQLPIVSNAAFNANGYNIPGLSGGFGVDGTFRWQGGEVLGAGPTLGPDSTVVYDGAASPVTVTNWSYQNLVLHAPGKELDWTAGATYTVAKGFTALGTKGSNILLRSTASPTQWKLNVAGGASISVTNVDVKDSDASGGQTITAALSADSGHNLNWLIHGPPLRGLLIRVP